MKKEIKFKYFKNSKVTGSNIAKWIVETILKLDSDHLIEFRNLITDELKKRGVV